MLNSTNQLVWAHFFLIASQLLGQDVDWRQHTGWDYGALEKKEIHGLHDYQVAMQLMKKDPSGVIFQIQRLHRINKGNALLGVLIENDVKTMVTDLLKTRINSNDIDRWVFAGIISSYNSKFKPFHIWVTSCQKFGIKKSQKDDHLIVYDEAEYSRTGVFGKNYIEVVQSRIQGVDWIIVKSSNDDVIAVFKKQPDLFGPKERAFFENSGVFCVDGDVDIDLIVSLVNYREIVRIILPNI